MNREKKASRKRSNPERFFRLSVFDLDLSARGAFPSSSLLTSFFSNLSLHFNLTTLTHQLINGDTGALPPAVARLGGAFTDGCAVAESADENSSSSSSPLGGSSSSQSPLLRAAARLWRYQGMR
jgi:hypothetical protein